MAQPTPSRLYSPWALLYLLFLFAAGVSAQNQQGPSIQLDYCASVNTNNDFKPYRSDYQSEGRCKDNCTTAGYSLAIIQQKDCWCSNTAPSSSDQKPISDCYIPCPGYPPDYCGGKGAFAYLLLGEPSSTDGDGTTPSTTSVSTSATSVIDTTYVVVTTETETVQSTVEGTVSHSPPVTLISESSTLESSSTTEPLVQTVTVGGTVRTVTATPSSTAPPASLAETNSGSGGLATGAAVGIAVGVVAALAVAGVFVWLWCIKRKRREENMRAQYGPGSAHGSSGMTGTPKTAEISANPFGAASDASDAGIWDANGKRRSHLMPVDPRLDPFAKGIYVGAQNTSHESIGSLQDNTDYSRRVHQAPRVLRAVNPDPEDD